MKLLPEEATLFYKLLFHLQYYVLINSDDNKQNISKKEYIAFPVNKKMKYRNDLWSNNDWIDKYVNLNPDNFVEEELEIIEKWKNRVNDKFFIERCLKKYAVFISGQSKVYGVVGITEDIDEIISPNEIPAYIETVLLPFKNKIIYDGLFSRYAMSFGRGIREMFKETYNKAKVENQIILKL
jgi:hypothetical protein